MDGWSSRAGVLETLPQLPQTLPLSPVGVFWRKVGTPLGGKPPWQGPFCSWGVQGGKSCSQLGEARKEALSHVRALAGRSVCLLLLAPGCCLSHDFSILCQPWWVPSPGQCPLPASQTGLVTPQVPSKLWLCAGEGC